MTLPFTCATGPMEVPVRCTTKKVVLSLSAPALDFGGVVSGEASSLTLTITNAGALPSRYTLTLENESYPSEAVEGDVERRRRRRERAVGARLRHPDDGEDWAVRRDADHDRVQPADPGRGVGDARLDFGDAPDFGAAPTERVGLGGDGVKVPIYLQREVVDLQTCVFGALYRDELEVCNRSKTALKVQLKRRPSSRATSSSRRRWGSCRRARASRCSSS